MPESGVEPAPTLQFQLGADGQRAPVEVDVDQEPPAVILQPGARVNQPMVQILNGLVGADDQQIPEQ